MPIYLLDTDHISLIAETALAHNAIVVTRNTQDFAEIENLKIENWA